VTIFAEVSVGFGFIFALVLNLIVEDNMNTINFCVWGGAVFLAEASWCWGSPNQRETRVDMLYYANRKEHRNGGSIPPFPHF